MTQRIKELLNKVCSCSAALVLASKPEEMQRLDMELDSILLDLAGAIESLPLQEVHKLAEGERALA